MDNTSRQRLLELDGLRGIAILAVLLYHYFPLVGSMGWVGVDLFFVLSGFLISGILIDSKGTPGYFRSFYRKRAFRILPLYIVLCLLALPLSRLSRVPLMPWYAYSFTANFWMLRHESRQYLDVAWSLSSEEQFYVLLPLVIWLTPRRHLWKVLGAMTVLSLVPSWWWFTLRADGLMLGVIATLVVRSRARMYLQEHAYVLRCALGFSVGLFAISALTGWMGRSFFCLVSVLLFWVTLLSLVFNDRTFLARICRSGWLRWLGAISYGLYLIHRPVQQIVQAVAPNGGIPAEMFALALSVGLASASWTYFEEPLIRTGRNLTQQVAAPLPIS